MDGPSGLARRSGADLAATLVVTIWGVNFALQKAALAEFDALTFTFLRFLGMVALGWAVLGWRVRSQAGEIGIARADWPRVALAGMLGYSLFVLLSTLALSYTTAFSNALLIATAPLFTAILLRGLGLEPVGAGQWLGMLVSLLGVLLFLLDKLGSGPGAASLGDGISLVAAFCFAAYSVVNKPLLARYPVPVVIGHTLTVGAVPPLLLSLPAIVGQDWGRVSAAGWSALAWSIWSWAIARVGVARTAPFMHLVPVVGGVASWLLLGEGFGPLKVAGAALTLAGLTLARRLSAVKPARDRGATVPVRVMEPGEG